ncbi:hypothetical protein [Leucobacter sp. GX24907]
MKKPRVLTIGGVVVGTMLEAVVPLLPQLHGAITVRLLALTEALSFVMDDIPESGVGGVYFRSAGDGRHHRESARRGMVARRNRCGAIASEADEVHGVPGDAMEDVASFNRSKISCGRTTRRSHERS